MNAAVLGKFQRTTSPDAMVIAFGFQLLGWAVTSCVSGSGPASAGSVADGVTSTGPIAVEQRAW